MKKKKKYSDKNDKTKSLKCMEVFSFKTFSSKNLSARNES